MMLSVTVSVPSLQLACPLCRDQLVFLGIGPSMRVEECESCETGHHAVCLAEMGKCGAMDCQGESDPANVSIDNDRTLMDLESIITWGPGIASIDTDDGDAYVFVVDTETASAYVREQLLECPDTLECYVGAETLASWGLDAMRGDTYSAERWLNEYSASPEDHLGSWDGTQCDVDTASPGLCAVLGFTPEHAYRTG